MDEPLPFPTYREMGLSDDAEAKQIAAANDEEYAWTLLASWQQWAMERLHAHETRIEALEKALARLTTNADVEVRMEPPDNGRILPRWRVVWGGKVQPGRYWSEGMARERAQEIRDEIDLEQRR